MRAGDPGGTDVLVVVADASSRARLRAILEGLGRGLTVHAASTADELARAPVNAGLVVLDPHLSDADAADSLALVRAKLPAAALVVVAENPGAEDVRAALDAEALSVVLKDGPEDQLTLALSFALDGRGVLDRDIVAPVVCSYAEMLASGAGRDRAIIESLAAAVEAKDLVTSRHLHAVTELAVQLARLVDPVLADSEDFHYGCLLHDVGKIGVPERILSKPAPLTDAEWLVMRRHPETGARVIRPLGLAPVVRDVVLSHHERWDGRGYPDGKAADRSPLAARIFSVADALEAMTADRPYRRAMPLDVAVERVLAQAGRQFDPDIVAALEHGLRGGEVAMAGTAGTPGSVRG
jgi:ribonuclease P protein subunit RPR2